MPVSESSDVINTQSSTLYGSQEVPAWTLGSSLRCMPLRMAWHRTARDPGKMGSRGPGDGVGLVGSEPHDQRRGAKDGAQFGFYNGTVPYHTVLCAVPCVIGEAKSPSPCPSHQTANMLGRRCSRALVPRPAARRASARSTPKPDNTTSTPTPPAPATEATAEPAPPPSDPGPRHACTTPDPAPGALARRLEDATEDALLAGGRAGRRAVLEDAGFGAELKARMLRRLADAPPWPGGRGEEAAVLRGMPAAKAPRGGGRVGPGWKVAGARDRAAAYPALRRREVAGLSEEERQAMKREWRERFTAGARAVPNSITGLAALANERYGLSVPLGLGLGEGG